MKLIIQIPCYNEELTLPVTLGALPNEIPGVDCVEWLIIDDGSTDATAKAARLQGVDHIARIAQNRGLAVAFRVGLAASITAGADIVVNTDADNQYCATDIPKLIAPILEGRADMVIGERPIAITKHFSYTKKILQRLGSWVVRCISGTDIPDATSGFRAMTREAAMKLHFFSGYTYTLEMIIQAGLKGVAITSVPIRTNKDLRPSRLVKSVPSYVWRSTVTMFRIFAIYRPLAFFGVPGLVLGASGFAFFLRYLFLYLTGGGAGHVQGLILGAVLLGLGFFLSVCAVLADLISVNRQLLEKSNWHTQQLRDDMKRRS